MWWEKRVNKCRSQSGETLRLQRWLREHARDLTGTSQQTASTPTCPLCTCLSLYPRTVTCVQHTPLINTQEHYLLIIYYYNHFMALWILSGITWMSQYQKAKTNLDFTEARDSEWHWHQLGYMQICTLPQTDNHTSTPPLNFLQATCCSCCPTNSVKAIKALYTNYLLTTKMNILFNDILTFKQSLNSMLILPSVLWCCWLGGRKGIRPAKNWVVGCWLGYVSGAKCRFAY